jgi:hypothetical protein
LILLALVVGLGGGRRLLQALRARRSVARLADPDVTPVDVETAATHGREAMIELFRLLSTAPEPAIRAAAGRGLVGLWARDELVAEEEMAIVRRGYAASWRARRRYPRAVRRPIPFEVEYGVPFFQGMTTAPGAGAVEWSHCITGTDRASLEKFSPWQKGTVKASFALDPLDIEGTGPFRLVLETKARFPGQGTSSGWEVALPHMPFTFELDPHLEVNALLAQADEARGSALASAVKLEPAMESGEEAKFLELNGGFALRMPPGLVVRVPLPCDLAHMMLVEFDGIPGRFPAGAVTLSGLDGPPYAAKLERRFALGPVERVPEDAFDRPGERPMRVILTSDAELGWTDPVIRAIWPEKIVTNWTPVHVVRI